MVVAPTLEGRFPAMSGGSGRLLPAAAGAAFAASAEGAGPRDDSTHVWPSQQPLGVPELGNRDQTLQEGWPIWGLIYFSGGSLRTTRGVKGGRTLG